MILRILYLTDFIIFIQKIHYTIVDDEPECTLAYVYYAVSWFLTFY